MSDELTCAALEWDTTQKDYIECDLRNPVRIVRINAMITVQVALCDAHRSVFEEELAKFDGCLARMKRVEVLP